MNWMKDWIFFFLSFFCQPTGNRHWHFSSRISPIFRAKRQRNGPWRVAAASTGKNSIDESAATEFGSRNAPLVNRKAWFDVYIDPQRRAFATTSRLVGQSKMAPASLWHKIVSFFFFIYISSSLPAFSFWSPPMKTWLDAPFDSVTRYYGRFHCGAHETWPISVIRFSVAPPKRQQILKATRSISTTSPPPPKKKKIPVFFLLILSFFLYEDEQEDSSGNRRSHRLRWRSKVQCRVQLRQTPWRRSFAADHAMAPSTATAEFQEVASSALDVIA